MKIRDAAFAYVANGWAVLPLWAAVEGACTCSAAAKCKSPGKHPRDDLAPHGVKDATTDLTVIATWPEDINLGVALGDASGGVMAFDIDDSAVAAALLHPDLGLSDQTPTVFTGRRGAHIWIRVSGPTATFHVKRKDGGTIGEMRGTGAYVVVPPSMSFTGREYKWIGRRRGDVPSVALLESVVDSATWVVELLSWVDIEAVTTDRASRAEDTQRPVDPIYPCDIPDEIIRDSRLTLYRQIMRGNAQSDQSDRSGKLHSLGRALVEVSAERTFVITPEAIAGVLKKYDATAFDDPKYANRTDADHYYWTEALNVLSWGPGTGGGSVPSVATATSAAPPVGTAPASDYVWDEADGWLYLRSPRSMKKVCNFRPQIVEDVEIDYGLDADRQMERAWHIKFTLKGGRSHSFQLHARDNRPGAFDAAIAAACPADYAIASGMHPHVRAALPELSSPASKRVFATTGWVEHGESWVYLLPGATGGITPNGVDPTIRIEREYLPDYISPTFEQLRAYGVGVRPPLTDTEVVDAWEAFTSLIDAGPHERSIVIALQLLAGPLASSGVRDTPPLIHVLGKTGSLKTSYTLAASSMFGTFTARTPPPVPWSSTANFLQAMLHRAKDLTLLFDDYKAGMVGSRREMTRTINNYADGTGRGRASTDGEGRVGKIARGLMLSNGEDMWEVEASTLARSVQLSFERGEIRTDALTKVQNAVKEGKLQLFGGAYLRWLAAHPNIIEGLEFPPLYERWRDALENREDASVHPRIVSSLASLLAVGTIVKRFVRDVFGEAAADQLSEWLIASHAYLVGGIAERADEVEESGALPQLLHAIRNGMSARQVCLVSAQRGIYKKLPDKPTAEIIGFYFGDPPHSFLITRELTLAWLERTATRRGDFMGFSWKALLLEGSAAGGQRRRQESVWQGDQRSQLSGLRLPFRFLLDAGVEGDESEQGEDELWNSGG